MKDQILRTVRLFEFYVRYVWPLHRFFVRSQIARRCRKCAASERMSPLDPEHICQLCQNKGTDNFEQKRKDRNLEAEKSLNEILSKHQNFSRQSQYDALILYSGGKDSTYLIHRIRREFPQLRILAYTIDNSFMSPIAKENVQDLIALMDVDHIFVRPPRQFYIQLFRYGLTHLNADGCYGTVDFSDGEFMLDTARRLAAEKKIPLILCGYSRYQVQNGLRLNDFESPRTQEMSDRREVAGLSLKDISSDEDVSRWWQASKWPSSDVARLLFPLFVWDLEEEEIKQKVLEWGLLTKKEYSPVATNHQLIPLLGVVDVHRLGYSSFEFEFCRMIREGKAKKKEWQYTFEFLEYTAKTGFFLKPMVIQLLSQLGLTLKDVGIEFNSKQEIS